MVSSALLAVLGLAVTVFVVVRLMRLLLKLALIVVVLGVLGGLWLVYHKPIGRFVAEELEAPAAAPDER